MSEEKRNPEWFIIVNPNAGRRKGEKDWPEITKILTTAEIRFQSVFTQHRMHAIRMARKYVEMGYKNIIVVGGDGTLNEVVNGIFTQSKYPTNSIAIGMIPVGTGNDWGRTFGIPHDYKEAVNVIKQGKTFIQDVGWVKFMQAGLEKNRYFANMAGMGYDAMVAEKTNKQKDAGKSNPFSYMLNIFTSLFSFEEAQTEIYVDYIEVLRSQIFTMVVGICNFNGGGMMQLPKAVPDDGNLDMTVITKLSRLRVVKNVRKLYDGSFLNLPEVQTYRGKSILIQSNPPIYMEADGESLGHSPFKFGLVPRSLKVIVGKDLKATDLSTDPAPSATE